MAVVFFENVIAVGLEGGSGAAADSAQRKLVADFGFFGTGHWSFSCFEAKCVDWTQHWISKEQSINKIVLFMCKYPVV